MGNYTGFNIKIAPVDPERPSQNNRLPGETDEQLSARFHEWYEHKERLVIYAEWHKNICWQNLEKGEMQVPSTKELKKLCQEKLGEVPKLLFLTGYYESYGEDSINYVAVINLENKTIHGVVPSGADRWDHDWTVYGKWKSVLHSELGLAHNGEEEDEDGGLIQIMRVDGYTICRSGYILPPPN